MNLTRRMRGRFQFLSRTAIISITTRSSKRSRGCKMRCVPLLALAAGLIAVGLILTARDGAAPVHATVNLNVHVHDNFYHPAGTFGSPTDHNVAQAFCQVANPDPSCDALIHT